ncbi:MAG: lytic transglycosylase domain-containing protein [Clostridia bacterium]|nr:lytic transglycosylase domain-containing protein [Clostridia bacterium]
MKLNVRHLAIVAILLVSAIGFGFAFDAIATAIERANHPRPEKIAESVRQNAEEFGIPEAVLWAVAKIESEFESDAVGEDGGIGLMQIPPARLSMICTELLGVEPHKEGMLYEPATNLQCGAAYLSHLYQRFGDWDTVFAAYSAGEETVDQWLKNADCTDELGRLKRIPDRDTEKYVKKVSKAFSLYTKLYY